MPSTTPFSPDARRRLNAFFAGINELPGELRAPAVREYLERGLARMRAIEEQHYRYLAECALLAANNVQDVRLYDLERRVDRLENPSAGWGEVFLAVALNVAVTIAALAAWELAVAAALAMAGRVVAFQAARSAVRGYLPSAAKQDLLMSFDRTAQRLGAIDQARQDLALISGPLSRGEVPDGGWAISTFADGSSPLRVRTLQEWDQASRLVALQRTNTQAELQVLNRALPLNNAAAARALQKALADSGAAGDAAVAAWSAQWREFIGGERGGLALDPVTAVLEQAHRELQRAAGADAALPRLPITSEIAGRFLDWTRENELQAADDYELWQSHVRHTIDADLKKDLRCAAVAQIVTQTLPELEAQRGLAAAARAIIVVGFEAAFWLEILRGNGYLAVREGVRELVASGAKPGAYAHGFLLRTDLGAPSDPLFAGFTGFRVFEADHYVGVALMTEFQATYLFHRFAKAWFAAPEHVAAAKLPFAYDAARYAALIAEDPRLWEGQLSAGEREQRLDEMKLLVIRYFTALQQTALEPRLAPFLRSGVGAAAQAQLAALPRGVVPDPTDNEQATLNALDAQREPMRALFDAVGAAANTEFRLAALAFAGQLLQAEQDVQTWQLIEAGSVEQIGTGVWRDGDELLQAIDAERMQLDQQYQVLQALSAGDPEGARWLEQTYGARLQALLGWQASVGWRFYPPAVEPAQP